MKANFNRPALQQALGLVTSVVPNRTPKPILKCVRIVTEKGQAKLSATDLEVGINCALTMVDVGNVGEAIVPGDRLAAIVRESLDETIAIESTEATCHITGSDSRFTIYGHETGQYPQVPEFEGDADIEITLGELQAAVEQVLFATAKESTRYAINGVLWEMKGKKLTLVATDGRRLARTKVDVVPVSKSPTAEQVIVPSKTMLLLERIGADAEETVKVKFIDNHILLSCVDVVISSNLVEGKFPKYEDIIPTDNDKKLTLPTEAALSAARRAALLTDEESKGIKISLSKNQLVFTGRAPETGDAQIDIAVKYKGDPIEIGFNPQFLIDALKVVKTGDVEFELGQSDRPGLIKSGNFIYVLMPINLS